MNALLTNSAPQSFRHVDDATSTLHFPAPSTFICFSFDAVSYWQQRASLSHGESVAQQTAAPPVARLPDEPRTPPTLRFGVANISTPSPAFKPTVTDEDAQPTHMQSRSSLGSRSPPGSATRRSRLKSGPASPELEISVADPTASFVPRIDPKSAALVDAAQRRNVGASGVNSVSGDDNTAASPPRWLVLHRMAEQLSMRREAATLAHEQEQAAALKREMVAIEHEQAALRNKLVRRPGAAGSDHSDAALNDDAPRRRRTSSSELDVIMAAKSSTTVLHNQRKSSVASATSRSTASDRGADSSKTQMQCVDTIASRTSPRVDDTHLDEMEATPPTPSRVAPLPSPRRTLAQSASGSTPQRQLRQPHVTEDERECTFQPNSGRIGKSSTRRASPRSQAAALLLSERAEGQVAGGSPPPAEQAHQHRCSVSPEITVVVPTGDDEGTSIDVSNTAPTSCAKGSRSMAHDDASSDVAVERVEPSWPQQRVGPAGNDAVDDELEGLFQNAQRRRSF